MLSWSWREPTPSLKELVFLFCDVAGTAVPMCPGDCQGPIQARIAPRTDVGQPTGLVEWKDMVGGGFQLGVKSHGCCFLKNRADVHL